MNVKHLCRALSFALLFLAGLLLWLATKNGIGLLPDSVTYIQGARDIVGNGNLGSIGTHYPPLYFLFLAIGGLFASDMVSVSRYLHIAIFVFNTWMVGRLVEESTGNQLLALLGMLTFATATTVVMVHSLALSEPLMISFLLLNLYFVDRFGTTGDTRPLVLSALFAACALLTRYVGAAVIVSEVLILFLFRSSLTDKRRTCAIYLAASCLPMAAWVTRNLLVHHEATSRSLGSHPVTQENIEVFLGVLSGWSHVRSRAVVLVIFLAIVFMHYAVLSRKTETMKRKFLPSIAVSFILTYMFLTLVSLTFFDAHTVLDDRVLIPAYVCLLISAFLSFRLLVSPANKPVLAVAGAAMAIFLVVQSVHLGRLLSAYMAYGIGYNSVELRRSETLGLARGLPGNAVIYTNAPDIMSILLGRDSRMLPLIYDPNNRIENADFMSQLQEMKAELRQENGVIVIFDFVTWRGYLPNPWELGQVLSPDFSVLRTKDGYLFAPGNK